MNERNTQRILQITANAFPPEIRVAKEGISLNKAGFVSAVLCPPIHGKPVQEEWHGVKIFRPTSLAKAKLSFDKILYHSLFFSPAWFRAICEVIELYQPNVIHVHDIWLGRTAFLARSGESIVMDLHENMPAAVVEYLKGYKGWVKWFNALFKNHGRVLRYERALLAKSNRVFTVVEEARSRVLKSHPMLSPANVVNIENLESKRFIADAGSEKAAFKKEHFNILYIGGFGPHRGIDTLIQAMTYIKLWGINIRVQLIGAKPSQYLEMLKALIVELGVSEHVRIFDWQPTEKVLANILQADVGTVPHHSNPHTDNTIPHKIYQYMITKKPILVSTSTPLARVVSQSRSGIIFKAGDAADCADKMREMYSDTNKLNTYAKNGYKYVIEQGHNWEEESAVVLISAYDELLGAGITVDGSITDVKK